MHYSSDIDFALVLTIQMIIARRSHAMQISAGRACHKIPCFGRLVG